ncbi:monovalent cation:proton antiporter-2 (CPA2) family protein [Pararhodospirillum photometricum]|nr:monovalent cation:proton antiporter-2 (CPA2) family protein [Pararhodospirillum photometricum]
MGHDTALIEILTLLTAAIAAATVFTRLRLGPILGYLVAGVILGPSGAGVITEPELVAQVGHFGVVFLLFLIGIELKPSRLWVMRRLVFGLGTAQVGLTGAVLGGLAFVALPVAWEGALVVGLGLALSSTAFSLQIMAERNQLASHWGRAAFSVLLLQDLAVVPLLALVPLLAHSAAAMPAGEIVGAIARTIAVVGGVIVGGRVILGPLLKLVAANQSAEVFTGFALLLVLGVGWLMETVGLSMALGAFLAGLLLADSEYRHQVELDLQPFRGLLLGLFFMSVGMELDLGALLRTLPLVGAILAGVLAIKALMLGALGRLWGLDRAEAARLGLVLAQAGEFGFVLFAFAIAQGLFSPSLGATLVSVIALSMACTPLLALAGDLLAPRLKTPVPVPALTPDDTAAAPVLIAGFGRVGETVARFLVHVGVPCRAIDLNPDNVQRGRRDGLKVYYGDASRPEILRALGADSARLLVITLDTAAVAERTVQSARRHFPHLPVHVRARDRATSAHLLGLGAALAVPETLESSLRLGAEAAKAGAANPEDVTKLLRDLRQNNYRGLVQELDPLA